MAACFLCYTGSCICSKCLVQNWWNVYFSDQDSVHSYCSLRQNFSVHCILFWEYSRSEVRFKCSHTLAIWTNQLSKILSHFLTKSTSNQKYSKLVLEFTLLSQPDWTLNNQGMGAVKWKYNKKMLLSLCIEIQLHKRPCILSGCPKSLRPFSDGKL